MSDFLFSVNVTLPVFLMILLGWFLRKVGILSEGFCKSGDKYVFRVALPVNLFLSISEMDLTADFSLSFTLFCAGVTTVIFLGIWGLTALFMKKREQIGAFAQAAARSSAAILGISFAENLYGDSGMMPMMIVSAVPLFNIFAVLILTFSPGIDEDGNLLPPPEQGGKRVRSACLNVLKNPIIIGILLGIPLSLLHVNFPVIADKLLSSVGSTATPVALLTIGAGFSAGEAMKKWKPAAVATLIKLFVLPAIFLPAAVLLGFRESALIAILIMTGSPTTVSCYIMAKNMHGDGVLTANTVVLATLGSALSLTLWIFLLKSFALI